MAEPFAFVKVSDPDEPNHADLFIDRYNTVSGSKADMGFEAKRINAAAESWYQSRSRPLVEALKEIQKGEGTFSMDHLEHASNTIESMKEIARKALETHNAE